MGKKKCKMNMFHFLLQHSGYTKPTLNYKNGNLKCQIICRLENP